MPQIHPQRLASIVILAVAATLPFVLSSYSTFQLAIALCYLPALFGLVIITGYAGQLALGNGAFFAIGAYTTAILVSRYDWPYLLTLPVALTLTSLAGLLIGIPSLRLRGHFLAVLTLAVAVATPPVLKALESLTNGVRGMALVVADPPAWLRLDPTQRNYLVALAVAAITFATTRGLTRGHIGRALRGLRDNEPVATTLGVSISVLKIAAFGYSAALAGLGGGLFAGVIGFVAPDDFGIGFAALLIIGLILGGKDSEWGAVIGSLLIVGVPLYAAKINQTASGLIFALLVLGAIFVMPSGLFGLFRQLRARYARLRNARRSNAQPSNHSQPTTARGTS